MDWDDYNEQAVERLTDAYLDPDYDPLGRHIEPEEEAEWEPWDMWEEDDE